METPTPRRPTPAQPHQPAHQNQPAPASTSKRRRPQLLGWISLAVAVIVITGLVMLAVSLFGRFSSGGQADVKKSQFQAVFLNNNQVYFGQITSITDKGITLKNIYYLQVQQNVQPDDKSKQQQNQQLSLAKLGGELHGPEDQMFINRDQVLFWENLKDDGKVVQAIKAQK